MIEGIDNLLLRIKELKAELPETVKDILEDEANRLNRNVVKRIREEGVTPYKKLSDYSTKGKNNHRKDRIKAGLQVEYKDLTFSGALLDGLKTKKPTIKGSNITISSDVSDKNKSGKGSGRKVHTVIVQKLSEQEGIGGTVIDATKDEILDATEGVNSRIMLFVKRKLGLV
jgi:hypothetical protein